MAPPPPNPMVGVPLNPMGLYGGGPPKSYGALLVDPPLNPMGLYDWTPPLNPMGPNGWNPPQILWWGSPQILWGFMMGRPPKSYGALWLDPP